MKKIFTVLMSLMILVGLSAERILASQEITKEATTAAITPAATDLISYELGVVSDIGSNNDIQYKVTNVLINASVTGYKSLAITLPPEYVANYTKPASWGEHISGNTINFIISTPTTTGTVAYITDFLENSFSMSLATENVFPNQVVNLTINISENYLSSRLDTSGRVHYYEFIPATNVNWLSAYNAAKSRTLNGLTGYLTRRT